MTPSQLCYAIVYVGGDVMVSAPCPVNSTTLGLKVSQVNVTRLHGLDLERYSQPAYRWGGSVHAKCYALAR